MFGAKSFGMEEEKGKLDYYAVAHRIKKKITQQLSILVGGTLKEYELKGLQWMVFCAIHMIWGACRVRVKMGHCFRASLERLILYCLMSWETYYEL